MKTKIIKFLEIIGIPVLVASYTALLWVNSHITENAKDISFLSQRLTIQINDYKEYRRESLEYRKNVTDYLRQINENIADVTVGIKVLQEKMKDKETTNGKNSKVYVAESEGI
jgi:hypothetical protein